MILECNNRGVSEIIGYVVVFTTAILILSFVISLGFPALNDAQDDESYKLATENFKEIDRVAAQQTQSGMGESITVTNPPGELRHDQDSAVLTIESSDGRDFSTTTSSITYQTTNSGPLVSEFGLIVEYRGGGNIYHQLPDQSPEVTPTSIFFADDGEIENTHWQLQTYEIDGIDGTIEDENTINYFVQLNGRQSLASQTIDAGSGEITVTIESENAIVWEQYFTDHPGFTDVAQNGNEATATVVESEFHLSIRDIRLTVS